MSVKRTRAAYESDLQAKQGPFVAYGTPLPPLDPDVRDDGSYVPVWKQEVTDERGRKRLHGAFMGGFSAGYFNTVGSKEGWTPSTFVSSRSSRKNGETKIIERRPEDFMDEEDLADAEEHQRVLTAGDFSALGSTEGEVMKRGGYMDLFKTEGETMGVKLLKKMGWREGQGVGPKIRRAARLGMEISSAGQPQEQHLFAPDNTPMITFIRKIDHKGLGFAGSAKLGEENQNNVVSKPEVDRGEVFGTTRPMTTKKAKKAVRGGIGMGVLNDTGSDDEDPYEIGPKISYNKVIGGDKKKKNPVISGAAKPVFISKKAAAARASLGFRKCHDGRLPLDGFVLGNGTDSVDVTSMDKYRPVEVPPDWTSAKTTTAVPGASDYVSTADAARASTLDPKSRAALLGEAPLPGKSVFDFLSKSARDRIASASGKTNLPAALGEVPEGYVPPPERRRESPGGQIPNIDIDVAVAALGRSGSGWMPYSDNEEKRSRYKIYLEIQAGIRDGLPEKEPGVAKEDWIRELQEFAHSAQIFKPMTGMMATRFTSSSSAPTASEGAANKPGTLLSKPQPKQEDPAEAAAKAGMFGRLTRSEEDFYPTRLLCKRFGVRPPAHVQPDPENERAGGKDSGPATNTGQPPRASELISKSDIDDLIRESGGRNQHFQTATGGDVILLIERPREVVVDTERNEALEGERPEEAVFKSIFGDAARPNSSSLTPISAPSTTTLSDTPDARAGPVPIGHGHRAQQDKAQEEQSQIEHTPSSPPPQYPQESPGVSSSPRPCSRNPPPFSPHDNYFSPTAADPGAVDEVAVSPAASSASVPAYAPLAPEFTETKAALPQDNKGESSGCKKDDEEPPPAYTEGSSPLLSFSYLMAAAGGVASILTQVQQGGPPPINTLGDVGADENITMDLRGTRFTLSRDELLTLPEFVLLSLFPNGLLPDGHVNAYQEGDAFQVDYDPASLQYMLEFFRNVAQTIPDAPSALDSDSHESSNLDNPAGSARDMLRDRAGIIVLREDLDFYAIPPRADIEQSEMMEVKRAAGKALLGQDGIFSGLRRSEETGTTEQHLIEMLTAGGFNHTDGWGHRAGEPNKAVICSLALARLRTDVRSGAESGAAVGMAQKLLLFWRKPARRCWWEGVELENVEGVEGKLKVWIRRVWTLEMSVIGLR
ncbi:hypothetical protein VF21_01136 [Pseudogymnoascus sp. 05NY08]|nr:hypothetical protein VF21_01136 [Pseudogymnoascus sp. 05NY08]